MTTIGSRIHVDDMLSDFDGEVIAGLDLDGTPTETFGVEIEIDGRFSLRFDDGEIIKVARWTADYIGTAE